MDWRHRASCRDEDPELFFPVGTSGPALLQVAEAKTVCRRCPVRVECLNWALESGQDAGVFGGMSEDERRAYKRRAGRRARTSTGKTATAPPPAPATRGAKRPTNAATTPAADAANTPAATGIRGPRPAVIERLIASGADPTATAAETAHAAVVMVNEHGRDPQSTASHLSLAEWDIQRWLSRATRGEPLVQPSDKTPRPRTARRPDQAA